MLNSAGITGFNAKPQAPFGKLVVESQTNDTKLEKQIEDQIKNDYKETIRALDKTVGDLKVIAKPDNTTRPFDVYIEPKSGDGIKGFVSPESSSNRLPKAIDSVVGRTIQEIVALLNTKDN